MKNEKEKNDNIGFGKLVISIMRKRWLISSLILFTFVAITTGILISVAFGVKVDGDWKEVLLLLLGAFIGSFGKVIDYWFSDGEKDKVLFQKMDEEDGEALSDTNKI
jgi:hypothetical protein